jgi:hypothetical protein
MSALEFTIVVAIIAVLGFIAEPHISWRTPDSYRCQQEQRQLASALEMYQLDSQLAVVDPGPELREILVEKGYLQPLGDRSKSLTACRYRVLPGKGMFCPDHGGVLNNVEFWRDLNNGNLTRKLRKLDLTPALMAVMEKLEADYLVGRDQSRKILDTGATVVMVLALLFVGLLTVERLAARGRFPPVRLLGTFGIVISLAYLTLLRPGPGPLKLGSGGGSSWVTGAQEVTWSHVRAGQVAPALERAGVGSDELWLVGEFRRPPPSWGYRRHRDAQNRGAFCGALPFLLLLLIRDYLGRPGAGDDPNPEE